MRICLFGTYFYDYSRNAVLRSGLQQNGVHLVEVHCATKSSRFETASDVSVIKLIAHIAEKIRIIFNLLRQYKKVFASDIIVVLYPGHIILPFAWIMARLGGKKLVFDAYTSIYDTVIIDRKLVSKNSWKGKILKKLETVLLHLPDMLLVDTHAMKKYVASVFNIPSNKLSVIPVGADNTIYSTRFKKRVDKTIQVVWFGGYSPLQGVEYIIQASKLLAKQKNIHFTLIGDGVLKQEIQEFARKHTLHNVTFISHVSEHMLGIYLAKADIVLGIFANNSMAKRVIPNKVIAGLASKKAVITASLPSIQEVFKHNENIYLVKGENAADLAKAITTLAKNSSLREKVAKNGYAIYQKLFTPKKIAHVFMNAIA